MKQFSGYQCGKIGIPGFENTEFPFVLTDIFMKEKQAEYEVEDFNMSTIL